MLNILVASSSIIARPITEALLNSTHCVIGILTMPDAKRGRGQELSENDFAAYGRTIRKPVFKPRNASELLEVLDSTRPDVVVTASYGRLIKSRELNHPPYGWLNVHFSLLPRWRGAAPVQRALEAGDSVTGVTVFKLDEGLDTGPIYSSKSYTMLGNETSNSLLQHLSEMSIDPLSEALRKIEEGEAPKAQPHLGATTAAKLTKVEGHIEWHQSNKVIERKIRAFYPWPSAWMILGGQRISIISAKISSSIVPPGEVRIEESFLIGCSEGSLEILEVKPEGKRVMTSADWLRGARLQPNARVE